MKRFAVLALLASFALIAPLSPAAAQEENSLIAVFTDVPDGSSFKNAQLSVTGLRTAEPTVVWPDGIDTKMKKIFENPNLVILQSVGAVELRGHSRQQIASFFHWAGDNDGSLLSLDPRCQSPCRL